MNSFRHRKRNAKSLVAALVLRSGAANFQYALFLSDAVSRYGGEEFLVVLPGCDVKSGCDRAEHIRHSLALSPVITGDAAIPLTLSMGAASSAEWPALNAEDLIRKADEALYRAKAEGRNRVIVSRPAGFELVRPVGQLTIV